MIAEGSSKLASVPSGGAGGAAAAGGAAGAGGAAPEEKPEEIEEGMFTMWLEIRRAHANAVYREGRVRRGYGFRSFRLRGQLTWLWIRCSRYFDTTGQSFWKGLCGLCLSIACHGSKGSTYGSFYDEISTM